MEAKERIKEKLKNLLREVYVDAYEEDFDKVIEENEDVISSWDETILDNLIKFVREGKPNGRKKRSK